MTHMVERIKLFSKKTCYLMFPPNEHLKSLSNAQAIAHLEHFSAIHFNEEWYCKC